MTGSDNQQSGDLTVSCNSIDQSLQSMSCKSSPPKKWNMKHCRRHSYHHLDIKPYIDNGLYKHVNQCNCKVNESVLPGCSCDFNLGDGQHNLSFKENQGNSSQQNSLNKQQYVNYYNYQQSCKQGTERVGVKQKQQFSPVTDAQSLAQDKPTKQADIFSKYDMQNNNYICITNQGRVQIQNQGSNHRDQCYIQNSQGSMEHEQMEAHVQVTIESIQNQWLQASSLNSQSNRSLQIRDDQWQQQQQPSQGMPYTVPQRPSQITIERQESTINHQTFNIELQSPITNQKEHKQSKVKSLKSFFAPCMAQKRQLSCRQSDCDLQLPMHVLSLKVVPLLSQQCDIKTLAILRATSSYIRRSVDDNVYKYKLQEQFDRQNVQYWYSKQKCGLQVPLDQLKHATVTPIAQRARHTANQYVEFVEQNHLSHNVVLAGIGAMVGIELCSIIISVSALIYCVRQGLSLKSISMAIVLTPMPLIGLLVLYIIKRSWMFVRPWHSKVLVGLWAYLLTASMVGVVWAFL